MEDTLAMLHRERLESSMLQCQITDLNDKLIEKTVELENATCEHQKREQELLQDNRRLAEYLRQYKKKASQLEAFRRVVVDTIKHEDQLDCSEFTEKATGERLVLPLKLLPFLQVPPSPVNIVRYVTKIHSVNVLIGVGGFRVFL